MKGRSRPAKHAKDPTQLLQIASRAQAAGRLKEAEDGYRTFLQRHPDYAPALHALGLTLRAAGRTKAALGALRKALRLDPNDVSCRANFANLLRESGQLEDALVEYTKTLAAQPNHENARFNLAVTMFELGRFAEAAEGFAPLLAAHPQDAEVKQRLLSSYLGAGEQAREAVNLDAAAKSYASAHTLVPDSVDALLGLGIVARDRQELRSALRYFEQALVIESEHVDILLERAGTQLMLGEVEAAEDGFRALLAGDDLLAPAHAGLGAALLAVGDTAQAVSHLERALAVEPQSASVWWQLARARRYGADDTDTVACLEHQLVAATDRTWDRINLGFALGKMCDDRGEHERAFGHYDLANALVRDHIAQPYERLTPFIDANRAYFSKCRLAQRSPLACESDLPVFVVGMPRSGTTLVEQILASHPQVHGAGELPHIPRLAAELLELSGNKVPYPECLEQGANDVLRARVGAHLETLRQIGGAASRVVDKLPGNFLYLGLIASLYPGARIIWCQRDPLDTCWSNFTLLFAESQSFSYDLTSLGQYYRDYERIMAMWEAVLPDKPLRLVYEDLVSDPDAQSRRLIEYIGLPWDDRCTRFFETRRAVATASYWQVRQPVYKTAVARWKPYEPWLTPLIEALRTDSDDVVR
jgi:tetratricopeptide (TPR) repeat protein